MDRTPRRHIIATQSGMNLDQKMPSKLYCLDHNNSSVIGVPSYIRVSKVNWNVFIINRTQSPSMFIPINYRSTLDTIYN